MEVYSFLPLLYQWLEFIFVKTLFLPEKKMAEDSIFLIILSFPHILYLSSGLLMMLKGKNWRLCYAQEPAFRFPVLLIVSSFCQL